LEESSQKLNRTVKACRIAPSPQILPAPVTLAELPKAAPEKGQQAERQRAGQPGKGVVHLQESAGVREAPSALPESFAGNWTSLKSAG